MLVVDIATHGLTTPDGYWKVMIRGNDVNAWFFPNSHNAAKVGKKALDAEFASRTVLYRIAIYKEKLT